MRHNTKRGRPKSNVPKHDLGTPELLAKRHAGLTMEPLDMCLHRGIISSDEHWAGIHLRWLYTVIFGAPTASASDPSATKGKELRSENAKWLCDREREYAGACHVLRQHKALPLVPNICIFGHFPRFLWGKQLDISHPLALRHAEESTCFKTALAELFRVFN